ncbi:MAG TPA: tetratricopeptide repeat protein [Albitalea sp.]|nr:tetratricopeptide repeat protein [Albitalea sp.]
MPLGECGIGVVQSRSLELIDNVEVGRLDPAKLLRIASQMDFSGSDALVLSACVPHRQRRLTAAQPRPFAPVPAAEAGLICHFEAADLAAGQQQRPDRGKTRTPQASASWFHCSQNCVRCAVRTWASLLSCMLLAACAQAPVVSQPDPLFDDARFAAPSERISADEVFAVSEAMRRYLQSDMARQFHAKGRQQALIDALYQHGELKLEYDSGVTRNAAQAFEARAGNCLSLVIMTAAFAKELGLHVEYRSAFYEETWSRVGNLYVRSGHVNLTLSRREVDVHGSEPKRPPVTIDFLAPDQLLGLRTRGIDEATVVAMYMNNRAAEALVDGRLNDAYGWARAAVSHQPGFFSAYNTLGVVYLRHGDLPQAEQVFRRVLDQEPVNTRAMYNLSETLMQRGRNAEAEALRQRLAQIEPHPPFHYFNLGVAAMARNDFAAARDLFAKEVERADYYHEFHFWLALANFRLGRVDQAREHLTLAMQNSTTHRDHDLYAAKLAWLRSQRAH